MKKRFQNQKPWKQKKSKQMLPFSYLFNFGEGEIESGVHPLQDFIPTYKVSSIHHSYTACGHGK